MEAVYRINDFYFSQMNNNNNETRNDEEITTSIIYNCDKELISQL